MRSRKTFNRLTAAVLGILLIGAVGAGPAMAKVTPKNGVYYQAIGKTYVSLNTYKGKVTSVTAGVKFKTKAGKPCSPPDFSSSEGIALAIFTPSKGIPVNRKSRFSVNNAAMPDSPGARVSLSGKFISTSKASVLLTVTAGNCTARVNATNARFYAGG